MRVKFTKTVQYETGGRNQGPVYESGSEHDFTEDFANRWIRRGAAVLVTRTATLPQMAVERAPEPAATKPAQVEAIQSNRRGRPPGRK